MFILSKLKVLYISNKYKKNAICGKNTKFDATSRCDNYTGSKSKLLVGDDCLVRCSICVVGDGKVSIGNRTYIGGGTRIGSSSSITIGNDVIIAGETHIYDNNNHPTDPEKRLQMTRAKKFSGTLWSWNEYVDRAPIVIEDNVWIGERCAILKGVTIGRGSVVGCNSVVTHDVPSYCVVAGNPARIVKRLDKKEIGE